MEFDSDEFVSEIRFCRCGGESVKKPGRFTRSGSCGICRDLLFSFICISQRFSDDHTNNILCLSSFIAIFFTISVIIITLISFFHCPKISQDANTSQFAIFEEDPVSAVPTSVSATTMDANGFAMTMKTIAERKGTGYQIKLIDRKSGPRTMEGLREILRKSPSATKEPPAKAAADDFAQLCLSLHQKGADPPKAETYGKRMKLVNKVAELLSGRDAEFTDCLAKVPNIVHEGPIRTFLSVKHILYTPCSSVGASLYSQL